MIAAILCRIASILLAAVVVVLWVLVFGGHH